MPVALWQLRLQTRFHELKRAGVNHNFEDLVTFCGNFLADSVDTRCVFVRLRLRFFLEAHPNIL